MLEPSLACGQRSNEHHLGYSFLSRSPGFRIILVTDVHHRMKDMLEWMVLDCEDALDSEDHTCNSTAMSALQLSDLFDAAAHSHSGNCAPCTQPCSGGSVPRVSINLPSFSGKTSPSRTTEKELTRLSCLLLSDHTQVAERGLPFRSQSEVRTRRNEEQKPSLQYTFPARRLVLLGHMPMLLPVATAVATVMSNSMATFVSTAMAAMAAMAFMAVVLR